MLPLFDDLAGLDHAIVEAVQTVRWAPATALFVLASAWWVKGPLFILLGGVWDARARRLFPAAGFAAASSFLVASLISATLKAAFDRPRPELADPSLQPVVPTPGNASFPSGHALTAFAAAAAVGALHPRLRWPLFGLAALVALSRVYLGVHYALDVVAGAALGTLIGLAVARLVQVVSARRAVPQPAP